MYHLPYLRALNNIKALFYISLEIMTFLVPTSQQVVQNSLSCTFFMIMKNTLNQLQGDRQEPDGF